MKTPVMHVEGMGTVHSGQYEELHVKGMASLKGEIQADHLHVEGLAIVHAKLHVQEEIIVEGLITLHKDVRTDTFTLEGAARVHAQLQARTLAGKGCIYAKDEVLADEVSVQFEDSSMYINRLLGDTIHLHYVPNTSGPRFLSSAIKLFGHRLISGYCVVDALECTTLNAERLICRTLKAHDVTLQAGCKVDYVEYSGTLTVDSAAFVGRSVKV